VSISGHRLRCDSTIEVVCHHAWLVVEHVVSTPAKARPEHPAGRRPSRLDARPSAAGRTAQTGADGEHLIGALVPAPFRWPPPSPSPLPALPAPRLPTDAGPDAVLLEMARLDRSGRVHARALLDALGWHAGHRLDVAVVGGVLVVGSARTGLHTVGNRGVLTLPAAARSMCGIDIGPPVVLLASLPQDVVVVHPASTVCRLLAGHHARLGGDGDGR
jgi:hypothetical protein